MAVEDYHVSLPIAAPTLSDSCCFLFRAQVGLKPTNKRKSNEYHPLEILWLRNYERRNPKCLGREITQEYNATFEGRMLPGETHPRPHRSMAAIACLRLRKDGKKRKREKKGGQGREKGGLG